MRRQLADLSPALRAETLQWGVGIFCAVFGAAMLVAPHRFSSPNYAALAPYLAWYGSALLAGGIGLLGLVALAPRPGIRVGLHALAGGTLLVLVPGLVAVGNWASAVLYGVLGVGTAVAPLLSDSARGRRPDGGGDLFSVVMGASAIPFGLALLLTGSRFRPTGLGPFGETLPWFELGFLVTGLGLLATQLVAGIPRAARAAAQVLTAGVYFAWMTVAALPSGFWAGFIYHGGFGTVLLTLPWLGPRLRQLAPGSLTARLAVTLAVAAILPAVIIVALDTAVEERLIRAETATRLQSRAGTVAEVITLINPTADPGSLAELLTRAAGDEDLAVYLIDGNGRVIAHAGPGSPRPGADLSDAPALAAVLADPAPSGTFSYAAGGGERLVGYARVPAPGWNVIAERSAASALASIRVGRELAFATLLLVVGAAAMLGALVARRLAAPLGGLAHAAGRLAAGDVDVPLPRSGIGEITHLADAFGEMRDRLVQRTAQGRQAEAALRESEERQRFLAEAGAELARSFDYDATLAELAHLTVPTLADYCIVDVVGGDGQVRRVAVAHADPAKAELASRARNHPPHLDAEEGIGPVLRSGRPRLLPEIDDDWREAVACGPEHLQIARGLAARSGIVVPLVARGRTLGAITVYMSDSGRRYGPADLRLMETLADRAAVAVDNARLYREATDAVRSRDVFLSTASHELRTPVTTIKGFAQLLLRSRRRGPVDAERLDRTLRAIDDASDRLGGLVQDLLDVARVRLDQLPLRPAPLDLAQLVRAVAGRHAERAAQPPPADGRRQEGVADPHRLVLDVADGPAPIVADAGRIDQVLTNLLDNAVKYSPDGGQIYLALRSDGDGVLLTVHDDGIGLPDGTARSIFEPFGRAANAVAANLPGMGLGLFICRHIVERHGGRIRAKSAGEGRGTTISVWLPRGRLTSPLETDGETDQTPAASSAVSSLTPHPPAADHSALGIARTGGAAT